MRQGNLNPKVKIFRYVTEGTFVYKENKILVVFPKHSKYYGVITELNYKQFAYNEILRYYYPGIVEINNILFLPGDEKSDLHFSLSSRYIGTRTMGTKIIEQYLPIRKIMEDYLT